MPRCRENRRNHVLHKEALQALYCAFPFCMVFFLEKVTIHARICTAKADFMHRLRSLFSRLKQQGFKTSLLVKSVKKFFKHHYTTVVKYNVTLRKLRSAVLD